MTDDGEPENGPNTYYLMLPLMADAPLKLLLNNDWQTVLSAMP